MKLWLVILIFGEIAATVGPLPYDMQECVWRAADLAREADEIFASGRMDDQLVKGKHVTRSDLVHECRYAVIRPREPGREYVKP